MVPPLGVMTVGELVEWRRYHRIEEAAGRAVTIGWQDWLREHRGVAP